RLEVARDVRVLQVWSGRPAPGLDHLQHDEQRKYRNDRVLRSCLYFLSNCCQDAYEGLRASDLAVRRGEARSRRESRCEVAAHEEAPALDLAGANRSRFR